MRLLLRNLLIACLFVLPAIDGSAQKISFCDTSNLWVTTGDVDGSCAWERKAYLADDTLISGKKYRKLAYLSLIYTSYSTGCNATMGRGFFVREDLAHGMVYYRQPSVDQFEHVLYNYNLQPGDTIQYTYNMWGGGSVADSLVKLDSALIGGVYHKTFDFVSATGRGNRAYSVIEGVGCVNHPAYPAFAGDCHGYMERLRCFSQAGSVQDFSMRWNSCDLIGNNFYTNCEYSPATTKVKAIAESKMVVKPNPARGSFEVSLPGARGQYMIAVHDVLGHEMTSQTVTATSQVIDASGWAAGTYFVSVSGSDGFSARQVIAIGK
ncbi:MAG: T9SS type A sorting domain-containing protein [Taibaiella sp.]|nr:T9SS type A sorting domain-containing protein [Taibaiella sp.]